jgi:quercetin dioxygenase-like cupin family protein
MRTKILVGTILAVALVALHEHAGAQTPGFQRTVLQRGDLSMAGHEAVMARAEFAAGVAAGKHSHPGEEVGYVLEGNVSVEIAGKPAMMLKPGDVFMVPAGAVHDAKNTGAGKAVVVSTYIVEKGKPLATPAQ